jgi:hypothetical protein
VLLYRDLIGKGTWANLSGAADVLAMGTFFRQMTWQNALN